MSDKDNPAPEPSPSPQNQQPPASSQPTLLPGRAFTPIDSTDWISKSERNDIGGSTLSGSFDE